MPLVLVHCVLAPGPAPNPYGFFEPASGFVCFLVNDLCFVSIGDVVACRDMLSNCRFVSL